jgi:predicted dehydrogenase
MNLTPEQKELGRRNFLKVLAGTPALAVLGGAALVKGPVKGGPVRIAGIGIGSQGKGVLGRADPAFCEIVAVADINPLSLAIVDETLAKAKKPPVKHYADWREMLQKEDIEGVYCAPPLSAHAEITTGCLEAGKHVFCEKMMAWDDAGCDRMLEAAHKSGKVHEIGYQRFYNRVYQAAYQGIVKTGQLGEVYHSRIVWNRNKNWRREMPKQKLEFDPKPWGYDDHEHLVNWRLYKKHSRGLVAELGSHMVNVANWFFDAKPSAVSASGGVYRFKDGREVPDHFYGTFEYPDGRTVLFTSTESDPFEGNYEAFFGTKGTLIFESEKNAYFFDHASDSAVATQIEVAAKSGPVLETTESRPPDASGKQASASTSTFDGGEPYKLEISRWCAAIRTGKPIECGPERAMHSAKACIRATEAIEQQKRLLV